MKTNANDFTASSTEHNGMKFKTCDGLTKREFFAALAMQGLLSMGPECYDCKYSMCAGEAVNFADALIAELNKENQNG